MKRICTFALGLFVFINTTAYASDSFRIASYNFENFWDSDPSNTEEEWERYKQSLPTNESKKLNFSLQYSSYSNQSSNWYRKEVLESKIDQVLTVLKLADLPDIVGLQEVESANNKSHVFDTPYKGVSSFRLKLKELGYQYIYVGQQEPENPVSVTTAFLSKVPLQIPEQVKIKSARHSSSARDLQVALLEVHGEEIFLVNNHWKSKRSGSEEIRVETAKTLRKRIDREKEQNPDLHVIILGDMNAAYHERPMEALGQTDNKDIFSLDQGSPLFYNLWYEKPPKDRWESSFNGVRGTLSHILVSSSLFQSEGLHYVDNSFEVIGHNGKAKNTLLSVNGNPYRWQIQFYYTWFQHMQRGYSDHLPLVATLKVGKRKYQDLPYNKISQQKVQKAFLPEIFFDEIEPCTESEAIDLLKVRYRTQESLDRKCVTFDIPAEQEPFSFETRGKFSQAYIQIPLQSRGESPKELTLGISMAGRYDWRPNVHDPRISYAEAAIPEGRYSDQSWHPRSNKCFLRKVLQRKGGAVKRILGRVGYSDGFQSIHIASRLDIDLVNLPQSKQEACPWY